MILEDSRVKLRRAQEHFDALQLDVRAFLVAKPYRIAIKYEPDHLYVVYVAGAPELPSQKWSPLIGDCVHNLRAALDYIAWRLAGGDPGDTETLFPIFSTEDGWNRGGPRRVKRMRPEAQALIQRGQPYHSTHPHETALNGIRVLDDADKHKLLTVVAGVPLDFGIEWNRGADPETHPPVVRIAQNAMLSGDTVIAVIEDPHASGEVEMGVDFTPEIVFGEGLLPAKMAVLGSLVSMLVEVRSVIETFESRPELFPS